MTVGVCIVCEDGVVLACDSLTTYGRGVPVLNYSNKVHVLEHEGLAQPIALEAAGMTTYFDKFADRAKRASIEQACQELKRQLDIVDFCESVCEPTVLSMFKEYVFDRARFLGSPSASDFSLSLIVAGATQQGELRAYFVYQEGLTERIDKYGTIGSGAAYAELFLRFLLQQAPVSTEEAQRLATYAIKGVELMDPNVGGPVNLVTLKMRDDKLTCGVTKAEADPGSAKAKDAMERVLGNLSAGLEELVASADVHIEESTLNDNGSRPEGSGASDEGTEGAGPGAPGTREVGI